MAQLDLSRLTPKALRTRRALIDAARTLVGIHGADGVKVMTVCEMAEVGRTSFYNYFNDVDELLEAVGTEAAKHMKQAFDESHEETPRGLERLEQCLSMVLRTGIDEPDLGLLLTSLARSNSAIAGLMKSEINKELIGAGHTNRRDRESLASFLTTATLALVREFSLKRLPVSDVSRQVANLMKSCR